MARRRSFLHPQRYDPLRENHFARSTVRAGPPSHEPEHASSDAGSTSASRMGCSRVTACVTVLSLALFGQAIAETPDPDPSLYTTDELVISATRTPEAIGKSAAAVTLLTREEILRSPYPGGHELDDLLRAVPGVQPALLSSRYNHPTAQSVTLNGLGSRRALVLLNGVPLNDGFGGWINWGLIPNDLERVEIVPGGISNLYGAWAMGGVIHVITRTPTAGNQLHLGQPGRFIEHLPAGAQCPVRERSLPLLARIPMVSYERGHSSSGVSAGTGGPDERFAARILQRQPGVDADAVHDPRPLRKLLS